MPRSNTQMWIDTLTFPLRAIMIFENDKWGLSSLRSERFEYCEKEVRGYTLDVGCGRYNWFVDHHLHGHGKGIDVFKYEGLNDENIVKDISHFPFDDQTFDTVCFIANLNHIPRSLRDIELSEAYRVLKEGGNILVTMANPLALIAVHKIVAIYDQVFHTQHDMDNIRGMENEESYYVIDPEIQERLLRAGFIKLDKHRFWTQWNLNWVTIGWKQK